MPKLTGIILAGGKGTRMKSKLPKALHPICGKAMTRYVVDACKESGIDDCVVVVGHEADQVRSGLGEDVRYAVQTEQLGTGDACKRALEILSESEEISDVLVTPGDTPLVDSEILERLSLEHLSSGRLATVLTTVLEDAGSYGRIIRDSEGSVLRIVEAKDATPEEHAVREINAGIYCFNLPMLRECLRSLTPTNAQGEYYLTDVIGLMVAAGHDVGAVISDDANIVLGVNDRVDLAHLTGIMREKILERLMLSGVTIIDPSSTYADFDTVVGRDSIIYPQTIIEKQTIIGDGCTIGPSTRLSGAKLGSGVTVQFSTISDSIVGDGTRIGPFANVRSGCTIGREVKLGDFVETKNAQISDRVSMGHLAYLGDASVGERTNIGAGAITCNYDGYLRHRTEIGKDVFVGSNATMVAPVKIGDNSLIAAGSVVTENVPEDALAVARCRQTVKDGWARERREQKRSQQ